MSETGGATANEAGGMSVARALVVLCGLAGWVVSYAYFHGWLRANHWAYFEGWRSAFTGSAFGTGLLMDLVFVTFFVVLLAWDDRRRLGTKWVVAIVCAASLSVSMMLLLYVWRTWQLRRAE